MDNKIMFYVINEEGIREDARMLAKYKLSNGNNYITYTYDEVNDNNMIKIYTTGITVDAGNYSYKEITTDDYNLAYEVLDKLQREYVGNFDHLVALTEKIRGEFNKKRGI